MKNKIEIEMAWAVWNLLENLKDKIWDPYYCSDTFGNCYENDT